MLEQSPPEQCCMLGCWATDPRAGPTSPEPPPVPKRKIQLLAKKISVHSSPNPWRNPDSPMRLNSRATSFNRYTICLPVSREPVLVATRSGEITNEHLTGSTRHSVNINLLKETKKPKIHSGNRKVVVHEAFLTPTRKLTKLCRSTYPMAEGAPDHQYFRSPFKSTTVCGTTQITGSPDCLPKSCTNTIDSRATDMFSPLLALALPNRQFSSDILFPNLQHEKELKSSCNPIIHNYEYQRPEPRMAESRNFEEEAPAVLVIPSHQNSESGWSIQQDVIKIVSRAAASLEGCPQREHESQSLEPSKQPTFKQDPLGRKIFTLPESAGEELFLRMPPTVPKPRRSYQLSPLKETGNSSVEENQSESPRVQPVRIGLRDARTINSNDNSQRSNDDNSEVIFRRSVGSTISTLRLKLFEDDPDKRPRGSHRTPSRPPPPSFNKKAINQFEMRECLTVLNGSAVEEQQDMHFQPISQHFSRGPLLGVGSFSSFHYARHTPTGFLVVLNQLDKVSGFGNPIEVRIREEASSPYMLEVYAVAAEDEKRYLIMEAGECTLATRIKAVQLNERQAVQYIRDILEGVRFLHSLGVAHGSLHSSRVMLVCDRCKLFDFSCASELGDSSTATPEADCLAVGLIAYNLLSSKPPADLDPNALDIGGLWASVAYKELVCGLLERDQRRRLSATGALAFEIFH